ncbi:MAG TPA: hypothetical protein VIF62_33065 [Labilithrix sp.]|jgi:hypothetical protein
MIKHLFVIATCGWAVACGGAQPQPATPTTTSAQVEPKKAEPVAPAPPVVEEAKPEPVVEAPAVAEEAPKAPRLEACDGNWVCVSISPKNKIDHRLTQLIGDPQFESTASAMIDDARGSAKVELDGKSYEIALRRVAGGSQIVLKGGASEITLDKHKANDFTYVGIIATKNKDGAVLVDIKYMK